MQATQALSYASGVSSLPLLGETIGANLERTAAAYGDHDALVSRHQGIRWTYAELNAMVDTVARGLLGLGVGKGDRVGIWAPNRAEWVLMQYATAKAGVILVNVNPAYRSHELKYALGQSGVRLLVSAPSFKTSDYRAMVDEVRPGLDALERCIFLDSPDWEELLAVGESTPPERLRERAAELAFDDPINIQYTSGTTGFPKGATLSHHNILNNGFYVGELCGYTADDRVCIPVPFYHCFGMVLGNLACTTHGAAIVIPGAAFDPTDTLRAVQEERCTSLYGVPTMFIAELALPDFASYDLASLRTGIMAGSPCPVEVMKRVVDEMHMGEVTICYGMTETSPVSTQTRADDDLERRVSTVGRVHPHVEVKVADPDTGQPVPRGEPGELCTRGYGVMLGYWDEPEKTREVVDAARWMHTGDLAVMDEEGYVSIVGRGETGELCTRGYSVMLGYWDDDAATHAAIDDGRWMHTGDLAVMDEDGYVNVVGRIKDVIIRGGENVYPREIEEFLYTHPKVADVQVVGVPDERYGEELCAWVRLRDGETADEEEIREYCRGRLAHFKVPRYVLFTDEFPMTVTGKVQKFKMREASVRRLGLGAPGGTA